MGLCDYVRVIRPPHVEEHVASVGVAAPEQNSVLSFLQCDRAGRLLPRQKRDSDELRADAVDKLD